ncbi:O-antigen translocase [Devosia sp. SD17-2]|uniref:O-antigen translocase n=1 Tax=Devosia sp. SD17-2 TaxID=2976459 RepID=UPI0023D88EF7|nr:O-antigen translocase [Devosia sp. SD17-2]WEJ34183.1 O-antigen translocase [Devosia sp. SD17-2]
MGAAGDEQREESRRYGDIIKSMSVIGLSQMISIALSILRIKVLAVLLGPTGVGLFGLYNVILDLGAGIAGMGVQSSGVRQVAIAVAEADTARIALVAQTISRLSILLGVIGAVLLFLLAGPVSVLTFGTEANAPAIGLLGAALFLRIIAGSPFALIQGSRRMGDLARMTVLGAVLNTVVAIVLVYFLGEAGVVLSLVAMAFTSWLAAIWYARQIKLPRAKLRWSSFSAETRVLLGLGFAFMASGILTVGAALAIRVLVTQHDGLEAAGNYQAAWALGGIYVGFILQAMGTDFYPRLSRLANDHAAANRLVNEQARVSMLLAGPGLLATIALSPLVIIAFYSSAFADAVPVLRWLCLGMLLRVMAWPMGYLILAKGKQAMFFWTEVAATTVHVGLAYILIDTLGLQGAGIAFAGLYIWHGVLINILVGRLTGFVWSSENVQLASLFLLQVVVALGAAEYLPGLEGVLIGLGVTAVACWMSLSQLVRIFPEKWIPSPVRPLIYRVVGYRPETA